MLRFSRLLFAAIALAALPQFASAGPVEWNYKIVEYGPPGNTLAQGNGLTDPSMVLYTLPRPLTPDVSLPDAATYQWETYDVNVTSQVHVYLIDVASGQSAWRSLGWGVTWTWKKSTDRSEWVFDGETEGTYRNAANPFEPYLGGNTYQVWVDGNRGINVKILGDTLPLHPEPEPGTLALAGMGLAAIGMRLRRR